MGHIAGSWRTGGDRAGRVPGVPVPRTHASSLGHLAIVDSLSPACLGLGTGCHSPCPHGWPVSSGCWADWGRVSLRAAGKQRTLSVVGVSAPAASCRPWIGNPGLPSSHVRLCRGPFPCSGVAHGPVRGPCPGRDWPGKAGVGLGCRRCSFLSMEQANILGMKTRLSTSWKGTFEEPWSSEPLRRLSPCVPPVPGLVTGLWSGLLL